MDVGIRVINDECIVNCQFDFVVICLRILDCFFGYFQCDKCGFIYYYLISQQFFRGYCYDYLDCFVYFGLDNLDGFFFDYEYYLVGFVDCGLIDLIIWINDWINCYLNFVVDFNGGAVGVFDYRVGYFGGFFGCCLVFYFSSKYYFVVCVGGFINFNLGSLVGFFVNCVDYLDGVIYCCFIIVSFGKYYYYCCNFSNLFYFEYYKCSFFSSVYYCVDCFY